MRRKRSSRLLAASWLLTVIVVWVYVSFPAPPPATSLAGGCPAAPPSAPAAAAPSRSGTSTANIPSWLWSCEFGPGQTKRGAGRVLDHPGGEWGAQYGEDFTFAQRYFWGVTGGTFLEMGALDGMQLSVSALLERGAGWRSILLEASPTNFAQIRGNRPNALSLNIAVCNQRRTVHYVDTQKFRADLGSFGAVLEFVPKNSVLDLLGSIPDVLALVDLTGDPAAPPRITDVAALEAIPYVTTVQCEPVAPVLRRLGISHVNAWVLDVEGGELEVLKAFDFSLITVDVLCMEANDRGDSAGWKAKVALLEAAGFAEDSGVQDSQNAWFVRKGFTPARKP